VVIFRLQELHTHEHVVMYPRSGDAQTRPWAYRSLGKTQNIETRSVNKGDIDLKRKWLGKTL
jgi:hypothetical protein